METKRRLLSATFTEALAYAATVHATQTRKGGGVPYIGHLLGVASIIIDAGGTEEEAIAGLLHDSAEDQGGVERLREIGTLFGIRVKAIVEACSDSLTADPDRKEEWKQRKARYRDHLQSLSDKSAYLVSSADKLHNLRSIRADYERLGEPFWERFSASREESLENYELLTEIYAGHPQDERRVAIVTELQELVNELRA